jgi:glycerate kinase
VAHVLIAFDKFKDALSAHAACTIAAEAVQRVQPTWSVDLAPLSDGGDGFCRVLTEAARGALFEEPVSGPLFGADGEGETLIAPFGIVEAHALPFAARERLGLDGTERVGVVEMAAANGLALLPPQRRDVWQASSYGTGELLLRAAARGADVIVLGVGGSATSDLGLGALAALGLELFDAAGEPIVPPVPAWWPRAVRFAGRAPHGFPPLRIACDVDNVLLGPSGAAAVYGPQKGLSPRDLPRFEGEAQRLARLLCAHAGVDAGLVDTPGAGAAGGITFGLMAGLGARLVPGFTLVSEWLELEARVAKADYVISGEGRFDASSWRGKGPGALAALCRGLGRRCAIFAGALAEPRAAAPGCERFAVTPEDMRLQQALADTRKNLKDSIERWLAALH